MSEVMNKYKTTYTVATGDALSKVKAVIMHHAAEWELHNDAMLADLLDDTQITADDVVDFLSAMSDQEEGNEEFHYAVRALQIALRKSRFHALKAAAVEKLDLQDNSSDEEYLYQPAPQYFNMAEYLSQY